MSSKYKHSGFYSYKFLVFTDCEFLSQMWDVHKLTDNGSLLQSAVLEEEVMCPIGTDGFMKCWMEIKGFHRKSMRLHRLCNFSQHLLFPYCCWTNFLHLHHYWYEVVVLAFDQIYKWARLIIWNVCEVSELAVLALITCQLPDLWDNCLLGGGGLDKPVSA